MFQSALFHRFLVCCQVGGLRQWCRSRPSGQLFLSGRLLLLCWPLTPLQPSAERRASGHGGTLQLMRPAGFPVGQLKATWSRRRSMTSVIVCVGCGCVCVCVHYKSTTNCMINELSCNGRALWGNSNNLSAVLPNASSTCRTFPGVHGDVRCVSFRLIMKCRWTAILVHTWRSRKMKSDSLWSFLFSWVDFIESISDHQGAELT